MLIIYKKILRKIKFISKRIFKEIKIQEWSIGIYSGSSPFDMHPIGNSPIITKNDIKDIEADYVADPFMVKYKELFYVFYEIKEKNKFNTYMAYSTSNDLKNWKYGSVIMKGEPVQSYPCVFKNDEEFFMVPESYRTNSVRLYKSLKFPDEWRMHKVLISGRDYVDPTIFKYDGIWWMFVSTTDNNNLFLFYSYELDGEWKEHNLSPIIRNDKSNARPAGNVFTHNNKLYRTSQDCSNNYGEKVNAYNIKKLNIEEYVEEKLDNPVLKKGLSNWSKDGMHTFNPYKIEDGKWISLVDGYNLT